MLCPEKMSGMAGRHPYGVRSGLRRNGLKLWDIHFRMTRFIVARCGLLFATLKGKTMKKMFVLFCMLFSCAFSLAAVNINAASQQELEALPGIGPAVLAKLKDQASVGAPAPKGPAKPAIPAAKK
ncbi:ComEA family DNA-binding protein [Neisseria meningitidis]|uniref:ComEA family DNA-binding protein n=1 Tax=Neisseria meningitidis TaxID=487 RepID=UPI001EE644F1|nr:ComEA family DNA-binding protein [Neisseria meningitidis]